VLSVYYITAKGNVLNDRRRSGDSQRSCLLVEKQVFLGCNARKDLLELSVQSFFFFLLLNCFQDKEQSCLLLH